MNRWILKNRCIQKHVYTCWCVCVDMNEHMPMYASGCSLEHLSLYRLISLQGWTIEMKPRPSSTTGKKDKHYIAPDGRDFDRLVHVLQYVLAQRAWSRFRLSVVTRFHSKNNFALHSITKFLRPMPVPPWRNDPEPDVENAAPQISTWLHQSANHPSL